MPHPFRTMLWDTSSLLSLSWMCPPPCLRLGRFYFGSFFFSLFPPFLLTLSLFSAGVWDPLSPANARAGFPPFFMRACCTLLPLTNARCMPVCFLLLSPFLLADCPALRFAPSPCIPSRHMPPLAMCRPLPCAAPRHAPSFAVHCPLPCAALRHAPPLTMRHTLPRVALITHHALPHVTLCHIAPSPHINHRHVSPLCVVSTLGASPFHVVATSRHLVWTWRWRRWCGWGG